MKGKLNFRLHPSAFILPSVSHQPTAAGTDRHDAIAADRTAEFAGGVTVPNFGDGVTLDVADDIVVVVPAQAHVAVAVHFHGHVNADALVEAKSSAVVLVVTAHLFTA